MDKKTVKKFYEKIIITLHSIQTGKSSVAKNQQGIASHGFGDQKQCSKHSLSQPFLFFWR